MRTELESLIQQYRDVQNGVLWMGANYLRRFNELEGKDAFRRPLPDLHSIAEILSHLTLWRQETILKIQTGSGSKTEECEENWLPNEKLIPLGWSTVRANYEESLETIIDLLADQDDSFLDQEYFDTDFKGHYPYRFVLQGMLHHDLYHLGQIGLILKYLKH